MDIWGVGFQQKIGGFDYTPQNGYGEYFMEKPMNKFHGFGGSIIFGSTPIW